MSFSDIGSYPGNEPDVNPYVSEPARNRDSKTFIQDPLTISDHIDPDKHWIGESLPSPSVGEVTYSGISTKTGSSPFPARADHSHDFTTYYGVYVHTGITAAPGQTFYNSWSLSAGHDFRVGGAQIFQFPVPGVWFSFLNVYIDCGARLYQGDGNIVASYFNGTFTRLIGRFDPGGNQFRIGSLFDVSHITPTQPNPNVQFAYQQSDIVNHTISSNELHICRLGDYISP